MPTLRRFSCGTLALLAFFAFLLLADPTPAAAQSADSVSGLVGASPHGVIGEIEVEFDAAPGSTLFVDPGGSAFLTRLCVAPCRFTVRPGAHRFSLLSPSGAALSPRHPVGVYETGVLSARTGGGRGLRAFGATLLSVFAVAGSVAWMPFVDFDGRVKVGPIAAVEGLSVVGIIAGAILATRRDTVAFRFQPGLVRW